MWNNEQVLNDAIRERENLEEITSPYVPILVSCLYDDTKFYIVTEGYKGCTLRQYLAREGSIKKTNLKCLLSQIVIAIGQVHECNRSYNEVNLDGIFVLVDGYILLNKFTNCCQLMSATRATTLI